jgi:hypothetical protein
MNRKIATTAACAIILSLATAYMLVPATGVDGGHEGTSDRSGIVSASLSSPASTAPDAPVLVELFTSQGCSSCPPADVVLADLADEPGIVALSRPVTYWDRLGWRDTLAREANTLQQRAYAARGVGGGGVYTPGAVVNGKDGLIGSQEAGLRRLIAAAHTAPDHRLTVNGSTASTRGVVSGAAELRFVAVANLRTVRIGSGENGGRTVRYHNVVLDEASVGCTAGAACTAAAPTWIANLSDKDRIAVVLQRPNNGEVLAARWL